AMSIILRMIESFLSGEILDTQNRQLDCFYQIISNPENSLIVVPRSPEGILSALVILTAFAHDMQYGIQQIVSNIIFVDPNNSDALTEIVQKSKNSRILSFIHLPEAEQNDNILLFGLESQLRQYFSALQDERIYDVISRVFGEKSNAARMRKFTDNDQAREIAQSISLLPKSEDEFIRKEILLNTVIHPGKDIIVTLSTPVMQKLRELSTSKPSPEPTVVEEAPKLPDDLTELTLKIKDDIPEIIEPKEVPADLGVHPSIELEEDPDAIPTIPTTDVPPIKVKTPDSELISDNLLTQLEETRRKGHEYRFEYTPLVLDAAPYELNMPETTKLQFNPSEITIRIYPDSDNHFNFHILTKVDRLPALKDSLEDLSVRIGGETHLRENHISLIGPIEKRQMAIRSLLWLSVVEYLTQVEKKLTELIPQFDIPKEGSILIVPPKRDFIREKIPTKFKNYVEEAIIRTTIEQDEIWTLGKAQEEILSQILLPLKQGNGVVFVASNFNAEMEEIALFLLIISEICGIGFSRW
ncbi:MAG: hypothetical protein ACXAD7_22865, partial [Candidatus Kariarchaeaceae archaeon]